MIRKFNLLTIIFIVFCTVSAFSQSLLGTQYPFGIPLRSGTGPSLSMGGTGIGVQNDFYGMAENPANLGIMNRAVFSAHANVDFLNIFESGNYTNHVALNPDLLSFCFPLQRYGTIGLSFSLRSSLKTKYLSDTSVVLNGTPVSLYRYNMFEGSSSSWQVGYGYQIKKLMSIGIVYERFYFNSIQNNANIASGSLSDTINSNSLLAFATNGIRGGLLVPIKKLTLGFSGEYFFGNDAKEKTTILNARVDSTLADSTISTLGRYNLQPAPSFGIGASYQFTPEWFGAADFDAVLWENFHSDKKLSNTVNNAYSFSLGAQYIPAPNLLTPKYFEIMQYRAGLRYTQLPAPTAKEIALSLGIGMPLKEGNGLIDFSFEVGNRSDSRYGKLNEQFFSIQLGINAGQKWYQSGEQSY
jgi:hypothetical protein